MGKHRNQSDRRAVCGNPFPAIAGALFSVRAAVEERSPQHRVRNCARLVTRMNVDDYSRGTRSLESCADEQSSLVGTLFSNPATSTRYPNAIIANVLLLRMSQEARPKWELEEAERRLKALHAYLLEVAKRSAIEEQGMRRNLALTAATIATLEDDLDKAALHAKLALNLTWRDHPLVWLLILQILRGICEKRGRTILADRIAKFRRMEGRGRHTPDDFILTPALWGLRKPVAMGNIKEASCS